MKNSSERIALTNALNTINRTPGQEELNQAATNIHEAKAIETLRGLVKSDFAQLNLESDESPVVDQGEKQLSPEEAEQTLLNFKNRFKENMYLHEGVEWNKVKASLEANPEALWSIAQMEAAGHAPDVYDADDEGFDIGTCSKETPESGRNCVYDKKVADWLRENSPDVEFNGSAVEMSEAMGIDLMDPEKYKNTLQKNGKFDAATWSYLLTHSDIRSTGSALSGYRYGDNVYVSLYSAYDPYHGRAWRGSLRVKKVTA